MSTGQSTWATPVKFTILDLATKVIDLTGSRSRIVHGPLPEDDRKQRRPDIEYARKVLGWAPTIDLDEGLGRAIPYFESLLGEGLIKTKAPSRSQILRVGGC